MYLLDAGTLGCFFRGQGRVGERLLATPPAQVAIPAIAVHEVDVMLAGASDLARRRAQWQALLSAVTVLPLGRDEAEVAAMLQAALLKTGQPLLPLPALVAGMALASDAILVTRDTRGYARVPGLRCEDWY